MEQAEKLKLNILEGIICMVQMQQKLTLTKKKCYIKNTSKFINL